MSICLKFLILFEKQRSLCLQVNVLFHRFLSCCALRRSQYLPVVAIALGPYPLASGARILVGLLLNALQEKNGHGSWALAARFAMVSGGGTAIAVERLA